MLLGLLLFVTPVGEIRDDVGDAIGLWKYCTFEKAKIYSDLDEKIEQVVDLALDSCVSFESEFTKKVTQEFRDIPGSTELWALQQAAKSRDNLRARMRTDASVLVADKRTGFGCAGKECNE